MCRTRSLLRPRHSASVSLPLDGATTDLPRILWSLDHGDRVNPDAYRRRASFSRVFLSFVRVSVMLRKTRQRRLPENGIRFSAPSPVSVRGASIVVGGRVEGCLWRIRLAIVFSEPTWIRSSFVYVCYS